MRFWGRTSTLLSLWALTVVGGVAMFGPRAASSNVIEGAFGEQSTVLTFGVSGGDKFPGSEGLLRSALRLVAATAPAGVSLSSDRSKGYDFVIEITDSKRAENDVATHRAQGAVLSSQADAYTLVLADHPRGPFIVRLFWDRLMAEMKNGVLVERTDAFTRLVAALGHEIYGNVITFKSRPNILEDPGHRYSNKFQLSDQRQFEIAAFRAGAETLQRVIDFVAAKNLPEKMKTDFRAALEREKSALVKWENVVAPETPVAVRGNVVSLGAVRCEALFRSTL